MRNDVDTTEKRNEWIEEKATSTATSQKIKCSLKCHCKLQNINCLRVNKNEYILKLLFVFNV